MKMFFRAKIGIMLVFAVIIAFVPLNLTVIGDPLGNTDVSIDPGGQTVGSNGEFYVNVLCTPDQPIKAFELKLSFDSTLIQANDVIEGDIFDGYPTYFNEGTINNSDGTIINVYGLILGSGNVSDPGILITISFSSDSISGTSNINLYDVGITNEDGYISISTTNGSVLIDIIKPEIIDNSPSMGYTGDSYIFNVSVTDNSNSADELEVYVNWAHNDLSDNESMIHVGGNYFEKTVTLDLDSILDMSYSIYAIDSYSNSNTTNLETVTVIDNDPPDFSDVTAAPSSQEIYGYVNISAEVTDNIAMNQVYLNITDPDSNFESYSITDNETSDTYYSNRSYNIIGPYYYYIWASDAEGNNDVSSIKSFVIGDMTSPVISNVVLTSSFPLDTNPLFGWIKITCDVTDNVEVNDVSLNITNPDESVNNLILENNEGSEFYVNTSDDFSEAGNYSYYIWADDTSGNNIISSIYELYLPPNWDINKDGIINIFDLLGISNHYDESGTAGWIREDVDNNGEVEVFDLVIVSNHYGEMWWEV